jgi:hypothetical protein
VFLNLIDSVWEWGNRTDPNDEGFLAGIGIVAAATIAPIPTAAGKACSQFLPELPPPPAPSLPEWEDPEPYVPPTLEERVAVVRKQYETELLIAQSFADPIEQQCYAAGAQARLRQRLANLTN